MKESYFLNYSFFDTVQWHSNSVLLLLNIELEAYDWGYVGLIFLYFLTQFNDTNSVLLLLNIEIEAYDWGYVGLLFHYFLKITAILNNVFRPQKNP